MSFFALGVNHQTASVELREQIAFNPEKLSALLAEQSQSVQCVLLMKTHVGIAVTVLYSDNHITDDCHTWPVAGKFLVGRLCIVLFRLYELVVEVNVVKSAFFQLPHSRQCIYKQDVQFLCCIEVVSLASVRCVCDVILGQFLYRPENSVCTACTECRM